MARHAAIGAVAALLAIAGCSRSHDAGAPPAPSVTESDLDVRGSWLGCGRQLDIEPDGSVRYVSDSEHCDARGRWSIEGSSLRVTWEPDATCPGFAGATLTRELTLEGPLLSILEPGAERPMEYLRAGALPVERWRADGAERELAIEGTAIFEIHGTIGEGLGRGCYWSAGECDGVLSCAGRVHEWQLDESGTLHARTACAGECPCAATIDGRRQPDGMIDATFDATNCAREFDGTLALRPAE